MLVTTDFAGALRAFSLDDGSLLYATSTVYEGGSSTGSLAIDPKTDVGYVTGFIDEETPGVVLRFDILTGEPMPAEGEDGAFFLESDALVRPIGIMMLAEDDNEMDGDEDAMDTEDSSTWKRSLAGVVVSFVMLVQLMF